MKKIIFICSMLALLIMAGFPAYSQSRIKSTKSIQATQATNWYATPCNGSNYWDFGNITPTGSTQTVGGNNYNSGGPSLLGKGSFSVTAAQAHYCFQLNITGSGYPYGADGTNGCEILILDKACGVGGDNIIADFYSGYTSGPGNQITQCGCWTSSAADVGKTYYIELSEGAGGGEYFGAAGFCTVYFSFETGNYTCNASNVIVLPIELTKFTGKSFYDKIKLEWATSTEINNKDFILEKSANGIDFSPVKTVKGANNSMAVKNYIEYDEHPFPETNYYRLKQVDNNEKYTYSNIIAVNYLSEGILYNNVHPNPTNDLLSFDLYSPEEGEIQIQVIDIAGRVLLEEQQPIVEGNQSLSTHINSLENGMYSLKVTMEKLGYNHITKILKN